VKNEMIGIYQDDFLDYLKDNLGDHIRITSKNIITPCPFCEFGQEKDHYHLYISLEAPIFHCFHGGCEVGGNISKYLRKIAGHDVSDAFIDKEKAKEYQKLKNVFVEKDEKLQGVKLPSVKSSMFPMKEFYLKKRMKFYNIHTENIKGLIYDVNEFININNIPVDETLFRLRDYLHSNFVGFLTDHNTSVMFRNVDDSHSMRFFKLKIQEANFLDYYSLPGGNKNSSKIVLAEGIFDIFSEHIYDFINIKNDVRLYASVLSSKYLGLIQSIVYYEQIFRPDVIILSDKGIDEDYYKKLKFFNSHIINTLTVYYNKTGKDFNETPVTPEKRSV
jgi:hypothetical protein